MAVVIRRIRQFQESGLLTKIEIHGFGLHEGHTFASLFFDLDWWQLLDRFTYDALVSKIVISCIMNTWNCVKSIRTGLLL